MKKIAVSAVVFVLTGIAALAQKSSTFVHEGKAIRGYDPVAYFTESKPVKGYDSLTLNWNNAKWYFSSGKNLSLFKEDPEKYAPQFGGYCAYGLSEGHKSSTEPDTWTIDNGKLYLNYNLNVKKEWNKNRQARIEKANSNWPSLKDKE
jgi:hypothetical protein